MKDVKKNFIYNICYQILILILPLITVPYVSRVLGSAGIGEYSYTYSIAYYFMIFAMLGINNYGNRTIAQVRDDREKLSKTFKEIHLLQIITSSTMIVLYAIYAFFIVKEYRLVSIIQIVYLISYMFDINWFFFGMEKFKITITRNIVVKIISLCLIFLFVKSESDVWIYTLILSGGSLLSQLLLWPFVKKYIDNVKVKIKDIKKHFWPNLRLFLTVIAIVIYKIMDKTMIGLFSNVNEVGFYENAEKIINIPTAIIAALGTVMLPRMSNIYKNGGNEKGKELIKKSMSAMMFMGFPMAFGLIAISDNFTIVFFGDDFNKSATLISLLAVTTVIISWGNVLRTQYLIPKEMDKDYVISAFLGAIVNLICNFIFIPMYASIGACYGTIAAEIVVSFYQTYASRKCLPIKEYMIDIIPFIIKAAIMFIIIYPIKFLNLKYGFLIQIASGGIIYLLLNYNYIKKFIPQKLKKERGNL